MTYWPGLPTNKALPSAVVMEPAMALVSTALPPKPPTVTSAPTGSVFRVQPPRSNDSVLAISKFHIVTVPFSSLAST